MRKLFSRKGAVTAALAIGSLIIGMAFATWTQTGSGSATAKAASGTNSAVTTDAAAAVADLYPGFTGGDLYFKIDNPNPYPVRFTTLTPGTVTSGDPTNCPNSPAKVTAVSKTGLTIDVPANTTTPISKSVADAVTMDVTAPDGCKGVTFTIAVTLSGSQQ
jgi:hypothetical protein